MRSIVMRVVMLAGLFVWGATLSLALQTKVLDPATGQWKEVPQAIQSVGDNSIIIWLFKPDGGESNAIAAVEAKGKIEFMSSGIVSGEGSLIDLRFFDPPDYDPQKPGKWQKITKAELVQGRVVITLEDGGVFTIYSIGGNFSALIVPGRVVPEPPKPATN
jgi:hypothetical protein